MDKSTKNIENTKTDTINHKDLLAGLHLSNSSLDLLDKKMMQLFTKWVYFYWL